MTRLSKWYTFLQQVNLFCRWLTKTLLISQQNQNNEYHIERRKDAQLPAEIDSCFFRDGKRRIDYILVYEDTTIQGKVRGRLAEKRFLKQEAWRGRFRANLRKAGLQMEEVSRVVRLKGFANPHGSSRYVIVSWKLIRLRNT